MDTTVFGCLALAFAIPFVLGDTITTERVIRRFGIGHELNPIARWIYKTAGTGGLYAVKAGFVCAFVKQMWDMKDADPWFCTGLMLLGCLLCCWVTWHNIRVYRRLIKRDAGKPENPP